MQDFHSENMGAEASFAPPTGKGTLSLQIGHAGASPSQQAGLLDRLPLGGHTAPPKQPIGEPIDIEYIATDGARMALERALTFGEITGVSIHDMVEGVIKKAKGRPIGRLTISGHGRPGGIRLGPQSGLNVSLAPDELGELARLRGLFHPIFGRIDLDGCNIAAGPDGERLLRELAIFFGVQVTAPVVGQGLLPGWEGSTVTATPHGGKDVTTVTSDSAYNEWWRQDLLRGANSLMKQYGPPSPERDRKLRSMGLQDRYEDVVLLIGYTTTKEQGDLIVAFFESATPSDRRELYRFVEGHTWEGTFVSSVSDLRTGTRGDRDGLYIALTGEQRTHLQALLNEGWIRRDVLRLEP